MGSEEDFGGHMEGTHAHGVRLKEALGQIGPLDQDAMLLARQRWNRIAKPLYALGLLEEIVVRMAGIVGRSDFSIQRKAVVEFCADNGVVCEGVSQTGQEVTAVVAENFLTGRTSSALMAELCGAKILPVDVGMAKDTRVRRDKKIAYSTKNMARGPAMSREQALGAIEAGLSLGSECAKAGYQLLAAGEMGIGNTTTSSAVASVLLDLPPETLVGRGAGLSDEGLERKREVVRRAVEQNQPDPGDVIDVLSKVGGLDIAAMTGFYLAGALHHVPMVLDGFISCVAALSAVRLCPLLKEYLIPSHGSKEPGSRLICKELDLEPPLQLEMGLGEGTGALCLFPLLDMGMAVYQRMPTFEGIQVNQYEDYRKRDAGEGQKEGLRYREKEKTEGKPEEDQEAKPEKALEEEAGASENFKNPEWKEP